jgi:peptidoglycan/xylan/chitin deacetylase (PgdA/CDA1 family)
MAIALCYHHVSHQPGTNTSTPELFRAQLLRLRELGYRFLSYDEFVRSAAQGFTGEARSVLVTTDDGNADNWHWAYPILRELGIPATYFIITGEVEDGAPRPTSDTPGSAAPARGQRLRWSELAEMKASGLISVQSHTASHRNVTSMLRKPDALTPFVAGDLKASVDAIRDHLGEAPTGLAWPWGINSRRMRELAVQAGFAHQFSVVPGSNGPATSHRFLYRYCCDGLPVAALTRMMGVLSTPGLGGLYGLARLAYERTRSSLRA